jgi:enoyl-CoA hydratase/carnithine racemase
MEGSVRVSVEGGILVLTLSNPATANSLTPSVLDDFEVGLRRAKSSEIRVLLLAAEGRNFCSGGDLHNLGLDNIQAGRDYIGRVTDILATLRQFPKPLVAAVQGHAVGGGAEIACEADVLLLSSDAALRLPDVTMGSSPATVFRLVRLIGLGPASRMALLGEEIDAAEAMQRGLAYEVVDRENLFDHAMQTARRLDALSPLSMRLTKQALALAQSADGVTDLRVNLEAETTCYASPEMRNAIADFLGKKKEPPVR